MSARQLAVLEERARAARPREVENFKVFRYVTGSGRFCFVNDDGILTALRKALGDLVADFYEEPEREFFAALTPECVLDLIRYCRTARAALQHYADNDAALDSVAGYETRSMAHDAMRDLDAIAGDGR